MEESAILKLPFIMPSQAQKHVTHNEALLLLDNIVQLAVLDRDLAEPPATVAEGDRYIVAAGARNEWSGREGQVAAFQDAAWTFLAPRQGWRAWVADEETMMVWDGSRWIVPEPQIAELQNLTLLGIGTEADSQNVFAAKLNRALWTARASGEGGDGNLRYTLNKEGEADVLSLLMQSGWSGRAELGLIGSDDFSLKVSGDGGNWSPSIEVNRQSGIVSLPALPRFKAYTDFDNYVGVGNWVKIAINNAEYNGQNGFKAQNNRFVAPADGTYLFGASLHYKGDAGSAARMGGRLVLNGTNEIRGSFGEISGAHESQATTLWLSTVAPLSAGDSVELQGRFREADGYFAADHTAFWGMKIG
ncbi:DUF2793 domain-containing protein [Chelativorans sp. Marseille-P2723]|uniref:DUF2793 domain-containing protein n=1 Tax=Chelativorans sp. Marseille-P2723 TaxID=2709133 RepID=UPI0015703DB8|nr:DUF2793 domain-containing protein [Chelativorans sp. Marseille-P2723]